MPPRSRVEAKLRSTSSARSLNASLATPERSRARPSYTARRASASPRQRLTPAAFLSAMRLSQAPSSSPFGPPREWWPSSATGLAGASGAGIAPVGGVDLGRHDRAGAEVDRVLRLAGQARAATLRLGDPRLRVGRRGP